MGLLRIRRGIRPLSARPTLIHTRDMILRMWIIESWILTVIDITLFIILPALVLFLAHTMHASPRVDCVIYCPIMTLPAVCERPGDFLKAGIEREIVADRILVE
jgi:hypothetical protein